MPEPVLHVALEPARVLPPDEVATLELVERDVDVLVPAIAARTPRQNVRPTTAADEHERAERRGSASSRA